MRVTSPWAGLLLVLLVGLAVFGLFSLFHSSSQTSSPSHATVFTQPSSSANPRNPTSLVSGGSWAPTVLPWDSRSDFAALSFNNRLFVLGGHLDMSAQSARHDVWSSSNGISWNLVTAQAGWSPRYGMASAVFNGKMWILGGYCYPGCGSGMSNEVWSSSDGVTWAQAPTPPWPVRTNSSALVFNNKLWIMGGSAYNGTIFNDVWYTSDGNSWTQATASAAWTPRNLMGAAVNNGKMWISGGATAGNPGLNDVYSSTDGAVWTQVTSSAGWTPRSGHGMLVYNNELWVMGGIEYTCAFNCTAYKNDVWSSSDGNSWTQVTAAAQFPVRTEFGAVVHNNELWVMGGSTWDFTISISPFTRADVWHSP